MSRPAIILTDQYWDAEVLKSDIPVLVHFWAQWCSPCVAFEPTMDAIADEYQGRLKTGKLDVDTNEGTADRYEVTAIPALMFFKNGRLVESRTGAMSKSDLTDLIEKHLRD